MAAVILYTDHNDCIYEYLLESYQNILPKSTKEEVAKFRRWQDRQAYVLGRLIIWKGLKYHQYEDDCLLRIRKNSYGKPYIDPNVFFNVSHSGRYVIAAFHKEEVGIDIEEITPLNIEDFRYIFSEQELHHVQYSPNPLHTFFKYWTIKESVIKAEGKGLSIPLHHINAPQGDTVYFEENKWHVKEINEFKNYCCAIATRTKLPSFTLEKLSFDMPIH